MTYNILLGFNKPISEVKKLMYSTGFKDPKISEIEKKELESVGINPNSLPNIRPYENTNYPDVSGQLNPVLYFSNIKDIHSEVELSTKNNPAQNLKLIIKDLVKSEPEIYFAKIPKDTRDKINPIKINCSSIQDIYLN